ncbi:MAG: hypothetical protein U1F46_11010 [Marinagarivorans sp.]
MPYAIKDFIKDGYANFGAEDKGDKPRNDGSSSCDVGMILYEGAEQQYDTNGKTGSGLGHAEMVALHNVILYLQGLGMSIDKIAEKLTDGTYDIELTCESKSCCVQCSVILGHFRVKPFDFDTTKCKVTMLRGGSWGMSAKVKDTLKAILKRDKGTLNQYELDSFCGSFTQFYSNLL